MKDYQRYINALRKCAKEHENDKTPFAHVIVSDLCRDTANFLEKLEQEEKWIPVSSGRMPKFNDLVLASTDSDYEELKVILTVYEAEDFWFNGKIEAWMPRPKPYKAESEG